MGRGQGSMMIGSNETVDILYGATGPRNSALGWTPPGPLLRDHPYIRYAIEHDYANWKPIVEQHMGGNVCRQTEVFHAPQQGTKLSIELKGKMLKQLEASDTAIKKLRSILDQAKASGHPASLEAVVADSEARPGVPLDDSLESYELMLGHDQVALDLAEYNDGQELLLKIQARQCNLKPIEAAGQYRYYRPIKNLPVPLEPEQEVMLLPIRNHMIGQVTSPGPSAAERSIQVKLNARLIYTLEEAADQEEAQGNPIEARFQRKSAKTLDRRLRGGAKYATAWLMKASQPREVIQSDGSAGIVCLPDSTVEVSFMDTAPGSSILPAGNLDLPRITDWTQETGRQVHWSQGSSQV